MATLPHGVRVFLCTQATDMRKSFDGLIAATKSVIGQDPLSGHLFVFVNRQANYAKVLYWSRGGYCLWAKRLERGRFAKTSAAGVAVPMTYTQLMMWLDGIRDAQHGSKNAIRPSRGPRVCCNNGDAMSAAQTASQDATVQVPREQYEGMQSQIARMAQDYAELKAQLEWFKRQMFGAKSEKRQEPSPDQIALFNGQAASAAVEVAKIAVPAHERQKRRTGDEVNDTGLRFGPEVPVKEITLSCAELDGPNAEQYEIIDYKTSLRLARQPGSHVVLKYLRPVVRHKAAVAAGLPALITAPAPLGVLDHAQVDVSFLAGLLVDKFVYHTPLYRQHQRLIDEGIVVSRSTLDKWARDAIALLEPIARGVRLMILGGQRPGQDEAGLAVADPGRRRRHRLLLRGLASGCGHQRSAGRELPGHLADRRVSRLCQVRGRVARLHPRTVLGSHEACVPEGREH